MRTWNPKPWFEFMNLESSKKCPCEKNHLGFRENELTEDILRQGITRILFLGDSFTYGAGICREEDRFSDLLERRLNSENAASARKYHIYNAGISGSDPGVWYRVLNIIIKEYRPHSVFAIFFLRDGTSLSTSVKYNSSIINEIRKKYAYRFWYRNSYIGKYIGDFLIKKEFSKQFIKKMRDSYLGTDTQRQVWIERQKYLLNIRDGCKQNSIDFHLVIFPMLFGLESKYQFYDVEDEIIRFAKVADIPVFSLTPGFIGERSSTLWVADNDQHPNEKANRIAARILYPYLAKVIKHN